MRGADVRAEFQLGARSIGRRFHLPQIMVTRAHEIRIAEPFQ